MFEQLKQRVKEIGYTLFGILAFIGALYLKSCFHKVVSPSQPVVTTAVLKPRDKEVLIYNDSEHRITTVTSRETNTQFAENPEIHIQNNGQVQVKTNPIGREFKPFVGVGFGEGPRFELGLNFYHFWQLDAGAQFAFALSPAYVFTTTVASLSYNVYNNTHLFVGIDPIRSLVTSKPIIHGGIVLNF